MIVMDRKKYIKEVAMIDKFSYEYNEIVKQEWSNFISGKKVCTEKIDPIIYESWVRSKETGVNPDNIKIDLLPAKRIKKILEDNRIMCEVARPYIKEIYELIKGSSSMVLLADSNGYILDIVYDRDIENKAKTNQFVKGSNLGEKVNGTNDVGLCIRYNMPVCICGAEHYATAAKEWSCFSAPVNDDSGKLIGIFGISCMHETSHKHTLGLVKTAAEAIKNEMKLKATYEEIVTSHSMLDMTIETIDYGCIVINEYGRVVHINKAARAYCNSFDENLINVKINYVLIDERHELDFLKLREISEREVNLVTRYGIKRCYILSKLCTFDNTEKGMVIILKNLRHVKKLANKVVASCARFTFADILGNSDSIRKAVGYAQIASQSSSTVLITGESGTGKELFAQSIHSASERSDRPFVSINCGALPKGLIESELFGYEGGSFTGAKREGQIGKFELAQGGTLFLDEIGDMPLEVQVSMLRVLQTRELVRVGGTRTIPIDVRVIAATNKNLEEGIENKTFREDLYYRLNVLNIKVPPLRERKGDIGLLADHFASLYGEKLGKPGLKISDAGHALMENYCWKGNIRELENVIERAVNITSGPEIGMDELCSYFDNNTASTQDMMREKKKVPGSLNIHESEEAAVREALRQKNGNMTDAARLLGIGRRTLYRKCEKYNISYDEFR